MRISVVWSMSRYIASSKIKNKPLTYTKYGFSIIVEKMEKWIGRAVHGPASCAARAIVGFFAMRKNVSGSVMSYFADRLFFEFLRSLSPGGECLIELKHWRFCLVSWLVKLNFETNFLAWPRRCILSMSLKTVGQTRLSFCRMSVGDSVKYGCGRRMRTADADGGCGLRTILK